jgi:hypothetical protein
MLAAVGTPSYPTVYNGLLRNVCIIIIIIIVLVLVVAAAAAVVIIELRLHVFSSCKNGSVEGWELSKYLLLCL